MGNLPGSTRPAAPYYASAASRYVGAAARAGGGSGALLVLSILFWLIFYQNLPNDLSGMASKGPVVLANTADRFIKIAMIAMSLYVIASRWYLARGVARNFNGGAAAFLALVPLSAAWSIESSATLLRFVSLITIVLVCFAITLSGWSRLRFQHVALTPLMAVLVISLVVGILAPDRITEVGTDISQMGAWHGITHSKNEFGMMAGSAVIICMNRVLSREARTLWALPASVIAFACLILSRSNTSLFGAVVGITAMVLLMRVSFIRQRHSGLVVIAMAGTLLFYELVIQNVVPGVNTLLSPITALTGKDTTFSARTVIWDVIKTHIQQAPFLGTGYGAYWTGPFPSSPSYVFVPLMYFYPTEAHNGYLDIINDLGFAGLTCVLAFLFAFLRQALRLMRFDRSQASLYVALLFFQMVMNMSESEWFARSSTAAVLMLATMCLSRGLLDANEHAKQMRWVAGQQRA